MCMSSNRYAWPSPMPCKIHVSMFRGECNEIAAKNFVAATFFESCQLYSLDDEEVSCRRKSMRISRQFERDEMFYRNDLEVIPFSTDATIEGDFRSSIKLPGFA